MLTYIYVILDSETNTPVYVGITNDPQRRLQQHLQGQSKIDRIWLLTRLNRKHIPRMVIVDSTPDIDKARLLEQVYINILKKKYPGLMNKIVSTVTILRDRDYLISDCGHPPSDILNILYVNHRTYKELATLADVPAKQLRQIRSQKCPMSLDVYERLLNVHERDLARLCKESPGE